MSKKHVKHPKIGKPDLGNFVRNEIALLGTNCAIISEIAGKICASLPGQNVCFMDADHGHGDETFINSSISNKISHWQYDAKPKADLYGMSSLLREVDLLIVNGNHEQANKQIVILDSVKEASLLKRTDHITDVVMILTHDTKIIPPFLMKKMDASTRVVALKDFEKWMKIIKDWLLDRVVPIYGLLLNGGKSKRMGQPKSEIMIGGKSLLNRQYDLLNGLCSKTYLSIRDDQKDKYHDRPTVVDRFLDMGPYGGILSAFMSNPNVAWLVMAVDLAKVTEEDITHLIESRDPSKNATAFYNEETSFPDPLLTIWEPKSYGQLLHFISLGYSCPRKVLINSDITQVKVKNQNSLFNMNNPSDLENVINNDLR
jgi:molybdopterin-guanine dinucleotide biosynthesis protein A